MKFGKAFESNADAMPEKWRPYVIRYNDFKKKINAIVQELDDRDLNSSVIKSLLSPSMPDDVQRKEDSIGEEKGHLRSCIKVVLINLEPIWQSFSQEEQLSELFVHKSASTGDQHEQMLASDVLISREIPVEVHDHRTVAVLSQHTTCRFLAAPGPYSEAAYCFCRLSTVDTGSPAVTKPSTTVEPAQADSSVSWPLSQPPFLPGYPNVAQGMLSSEQKNDEPKEIFATPKR
ncbi:hypothetical protein BKA57DRAFT_540434 [Linnemannia elongata]|nr:hypothetical protein BKA57DRAFT_540434 [Linnemannia elongata]